MAELLTAVRLVCGSQERVAALPHVAHTIDNFLWVVTSTWSLENASKPGFIRLMDHLLKIEWPYYTQRCREGRLHRALRAAVCRGYDAQVVEWWFKTYMPGQTVLPLTTVYKLAFRHTRLQPLEWIYQEIDGDLPSPEYCESPDTVAWLLDHGDHSCTRLSLHHGYESEATFQSIKRCFTYRDENDSFEIYGSEYVLDEAIHRGRLEDLKWLHKHRPQLFDTNHTALHRSNHNAAKLLRNAVRYGNLDVAKWLADTFPELQLNDPRRSFEDSLEDLRPYRYNLDMLKWVLCEFFWRKPRNRSYWMCDARDYAARSGNLEMLEFVYKIRMKNFSSFQAASKAMRRWGESQSPVMDDAAALGRLDILQFFHGHRSRRYTARALSVAAANGHLEVVQWLHKNRSKGCTTKAMDAAAANGHLEIVQWLNQQRSEGCKAVRQNLEALLVEMRLKKSGCTGTDQRANLLKRWIQIMDFLKELRKCDTLAPVKCYCTNAMKSHARPDNSAVGEGATRRHIVSERLMDDLKCHHQA